jgi:hypothetical protein
MSNSESIAPVAAECRIGCVDRKDSGVNHEMQLWMHKHDGRYHFEVKQWYKTSVRYVRACTLETGKPQASYALALDQGQAAMKRLLKS